MRCIVFDSGTTGVSIDLSSGEPTVTSHFSQDKNYKYACFDGVGQKPFYQGNTLMIDDIYLMTMSRSPVGKEKMLELFNTTFKGVSFQEQWLVDSDMLKGIVKPERNLHKMLALALGYGMGPKKMVKQCYDKGHTLSFKHAKEFYNEYWDLFESVRKLERGLARRVKERGWIVNPFGYRLVPEPHKAFNYFIQSSVSGIMHLYGLYLFELAPYAKFITCIHDEFLVQVPDDYLDQFRIDSAAATQKLNDKIKWTVNIRTGFQAGKDWYEAK